MQSIREDLVLLRKKAAECALAALLASDEHARLDNRACVKIYRELIEEIERRPPREKQGRHAS